MSDCRMCASEGGSSNIPRNPPNDIRKASTPLFKESVVLHIVLSRYQPAICNFKYPFGEIQDQNIMANEVVAAKRGDIKSWLFLAESLALRLRTPGKRGNGPCSRLNMQVREYGEMVTFNWILELRSLQKVKAVKEEGRRST